MFWSTWSTHCIYKYLLIAIIWSLNIIKFIKIMASARRNDFHQKECTGVSPEKTTLKKLSLVKIKQIVMKYWSDKSLCKKSITKQNIDTPVK